jgi:hypothetical protein
MLWIWWFPDPRSLPSSSPPPRLLSPPATRSHPLTDASQTLDAALEEPDAVLGPIPAALEGVKQAIAAGLSDPIELNAGVTESVGIFRHSPEPWKSFQLMLMNPVHTSAPSHSPNLSCPQGQGVCGSYASRGLVPRRDA